LPARSLLRLWQICRHVRGDEARSHTVHGDAAAAQLLGQSTGHASYASLGCSVVGLTGIARGSNHAGDADDAAETLLHHGTNSRTADSENSLQIGVGDGIPIVILHAHCQGIAGNTCVVDQHMQAAVILDDGVDQGIHGSAVGHVQRDPAAAEGGQRLPDLLGTGIRGGRADHQIALLR
jgi:hypothetical protein